MPIRIEVMIAEQADMPSPGLRTVHLEFRSYGRGPLTADEEQAARRIQGAIVLIAEAEARNTVRTEIVEREFPNGTGNKEGA